MSESKAQSGIDRRSFLRSTAAVGAGLAFAPRMFAAASGGEKDINVALLGAGAEGQILMEACLKIPNLKFKAVCDIWEGYNQKRVANLLRRYQHECNTYVDYKDMLDKEKGKIDAVIIATPDFWHAEQAITCMEAGLDVYCEKEMSNDLGKARQMVEAQKKTGKLLQIGHQRRSNPRYLHCYNKVLKEAKMLGRITTVNGQWNRGVQEPLSSPPKYAIDDATLAKYGFSSMEQFRNWRWYKKLGGGPIVDLGSHQIDIYAWFLDAMPKGVIASGGTDYYDKNTHEWYDTVMSIFDFETKEGVVRAYYQVLTTNSNQGYFETFMGDQGSLVISESASRGSVYREQSAQVEWDKWVKLGFVNEPKKEEKKADATTAALDVRETLAPPAYEIPVKMEGTPYHQPHLANFFNAMRGKEKLNCPAEVGYETAVMVLKVNEAVEAQRRLEFKPEEFKV
ncbi:MAG TPA: Gfo/Idh/MocA family oxidoreductase [Sedimentisphaerales bacterium]|jgi:predicted dehydrogenase|nr:Gfo/Idh/MocA family oxidoreductase [Sedimentisphaerales bacterium]HNU27604.1 Gfo/Idh/MocA family oxidoreductase [Sedimentisphaerales bacterium]